MGGTRVMTVLFTDVVGSTALACRLEPALADQVREAHFGLLRAVKRNVTIPEGRLTTPTSSGTLTASTEAAADPCHCRAPPFRRHPSGGRTE